MFLEEELSNWGRYPKMKVKMTYPTSYERVLNAIEEAQHDIIPRGNGRCYGDAALAPHVISSIRLNKFINFDERDHILTIESGVLLSEILDFAVPKGLFLPVTPGTKYITIGGALAADVHGKNHHKDGCISDWITAFTIIDARDLQIKTCSRTQHVDLFWDTVGGMGLTGYILDVSIKLIKIESSYIRQESIKAKDLDAIFQLFEDSEDWTYTVSWIDCLQKGKNLGRSIMMRGEHATYDELPAHLKLEALQVYNKSLINVPIDFPSFTLNTLSVKAFNFVYYNKQLKDFKAHFNNYGSFFYPLDIVGEWNKIYGKNGFIQYQFVLPLAHSRAGMIEVLEAIAHSGQGSFLTVLKKFGKNNPLAHNSFPIPGYTLALDFKVNKQLPQLIQKLDNIILKYEGRVYRAKDSLSDPRLSNYLKIEESTHFNSVQNKRILQ